MKMVLRAILVTALVAGVLAGGGALYIHRDLAAARQLLARGDHVVAQRRLRRYLQIYRHDPHARLLLAEAIVADDDRPAEDTAHEALVQLDRVPDSSPLAVQARTRSGRLLFLILLRAGEAERLFRRAIELQPEALDPHLMLWNLMNVTGRFHLTQPLFWRVYELSQPQDKPQRLRAWYLSEFGRGTAFAGLDRKLGFLAERDQPSVISEYDRLRHMAAAEPDWPIARAALARLLYGERRKDLAREILDEAAPGADRDPFFLATRIELAMEAAHFDEARELFDHWPEPHDGYEFWMWRGTIADEVRGDDADAIVAYQNALAAPLGDTDWQLMSRLAHCLLRAGRADEARATRERAAALEKLMERDLHAGLRKAFAELQSPAAIRQIVEFYGKLGRDREVAEWNRWLRGIETAGAVAPDPTVDRKLPAD